MTVRIWDNPRTISNLNCLFSMHNWKWVNLRKNGQFQYKLKLKWKAKWLRQKAQQRLTSRSVYLFPLLFRRLLPFSFRSTVKQTKLFHSISEMFFTFLARKTLWVKLFSLNVCEVALPAAMKGGSFGSKLTHLCGFWLDVSFFSRVKTIVRSSDWLELICVRKFTT